MVVDSEQLGFETAKKEIHGPEISQHWFRSRAIYFRSIRCTRDWHGLIGIFRRRRTGSSVSTDGHWWVTRQLQQQSAL